MPPTTLAILADTHMPRGARALPDRCVELLRGADLIVHAGDFAELAVVGELRALGPPLVAVHGNVDSRPVRDELPAERTIEVECARIAVVHDAGPARGRLARLRRRFPDADAVIFGHSHIPLHERDDQAGFQILNPGSPTERRRAPSHTMALGRVERGRVQLELVELD